MQHDSVHAPAPGHREATPSGSTGRPGHTGSGPLGLQRPSRHRPSRHRHAARACIVTLAVVAVLTGGALLPGRSDAAPTSSDPVTAAQHGARWAAARVTADGYVPGPTNAPNVSATIETALALQQADVEEATYRRVVSWLEAHVDLAIDPDGVGDSAGNLGQLLLIAAAAGEDGTSFGGQDLEARLAATLGQFAPGLYGKSDPTYDGAFRQSLAILGLHAAGATPAAAAVGWLQDQQCGASVAAAAGGWQPFRADPAVPCVAPNTTTFEGPDTNSTALAVQALAAAGALSGSARAAALDFLAAAQAPTAGFAYIPGGDVDPNSTALVVLAIIAGGEDPGAGRWVHGGATPLTSLLSWQLGCAAAATDQGAFASPFSGGAPDDLATRQAIWGAAERPFGATAAVTFQSASVPCQSTATTTTSPTTTGPSSTATAVDPATSTTIFGSGTGTPPAAQPATAVVARPALAG